MLKLLAKEIKLTMHPATPLFLALAAMMLIPNYPYEITFFYICLGIFFTCLNGRENNDIIYTLSLPVKKTDIVKARFSLVIALEMLQVVLAIPFAMLRQSYPDLPRNEAGMDANIALFGISLAMLGLFNIIFFGVYYKNTYKVGKAFVLATIGMFAFLLVDMTCCFAVPFVRDFLDTPDSMYIEYKLPVLAAGFVFYVVLTAISYINAKKNFIKQDQ